MHRAQKYASREWETLLRRAMRSGRLIPSELLASYRGIGFDGHRGLDEPRRVDVEAMLAALDALPAGFVEVRKILAVSDLSQFSGEPIEALSLMLSDGTIIHEVGPALSGLMELASHLCVLEFEFTKATRLLAESGREENQEQERDQEQKDVEEQTSEDDEGRGEDLTRVAFVLGSQVELLEHLIDEHGEGVWRMLHGQQRLPSVGIHADLCPEGLDRRGARAGDSITRHLAEMGYLARPVHLWVGSEVLTECVSPYARDLRDVLRTWAQYQHEQHTADLGDDIDPPSECPTQDEMLAIAHDFLHTDAHLLEERDAADRRVGILRRSITLDAGEHAITFETIDLGRIDANACDPRITDWQLTSPAPVILRLSPDLLDPDASTLATLLNTVGKSIASVTVVLGGTHLHAPPGHILQPHTAVHWAGTHKVVLPAPPLLAPHEVEACAAHPVQQGALLSLPSPAVFSTAHTTSVQQRLGIASVDISGAGIIESLADAMWCGEVHSSTPMSVFVVGMQQASTGRPTLACQSGLSAVAVAMLRKLTEGTPEVATRQHEVEDETPDDEMAASGGSDAINPTGTPRRHYGLRIKA